MICRRVSLIYGYSYPQCVSLITDRKFLDGPPDLARKCDPWLGRLCDACRHTMPASETSLPDISESIALSVLVEALIADLPSARTNTVAALAAHRASVSWEQEFETLASWFEAGELYKSFCNH